jgi:hypothetical protein
MTLAAGDMMQYELLKRLPITDFLNKLDHFIPKTDVKIPLTPTR